MSTTTTATLTPAAPAGSVRVSAPPRPAAPRGRPSPGTRPTPTRPGPPRLLLPPLVDPVGTRLPAVREADVPVRSVVTSPVTDVPRTAWGADPSRRRSTSLPREPHPASSGATLPDPEAACSVIALAAVELLAGRRSPAQLLRWVTPELYDRLVAQALPADLRQVLGSRPVRVVRTVCCRLDESTTEASVVLHDGTRVRAAAVRVQAHRGRWRATALEIG